MVRPVIHSTKHYVQFPFNDVTTGTRDGVQLAISVSTVDKNTSSEVEEGCSIKAVFVELWLQNSGVDGTSIVTLEKAGQGSTGISFAEMASIMTYNNKKNVLFTHEGLTSNDGVSGPTVVMRGWFKIPKSKQRFGLDDRLVLSISNTSAGDLHTCGFATYKEYT